MKVGIRKPNFKKTFKARTTGKLKRKIKKSVNPLYGKKGMGTLKNPKRALYNKTYHRTTVGISNEAWIHIILFLTTAGIGNIIYLIYRSKK